MPGTGATFYPCLFYTDPRAAIRSLQEAFGFETRVIIDAPDGSVRHAEISLNGAILMIGTATADGRLTSPRNLPGKNQTIYVGVADPDALYERARKAGVRITREPNNTSFGSREFGCEDLEGNEWAFGTYRPAVSSEQ